MPKHTTSPGGITGVGIAKDSNITQNFINGTKPRCPAYLSKTDPHVVKTRIEETKGGLLKDASSWILHHADFQQWHDGESQLLWVKGDPGKGKTMLLCTIIDKLEGETKLRDPGATTLLSYFFCQATDPSFNNATAVLRGLIYLLVKQYDSLLPHLRDKFDDSGQPRFEDAKAWAELSGIFVNILRDGNLPRTALIIDALDECVSGRNQLVDFVRRNASSCVQWIMSSRNDVELQEKFNCPHSILSLEQPGNAKAVSRAVEAYINSKTAHIESLQSGSSLQDHVREVLGQKADGTFLWAALVIQELKQAKPWNVRRVVDEVPVGLNELYARMIEQIRRLEGFEPEYCRFVLSAATLAYRPLRLPELGAVSGLPDEISCESEWVRQIVTMSGSFLTVRGETVYFVHQSAKDYLIGKAASSIFPAGPAAAHHAIFRQSLNVLRKSLRHNICSLPYPGSSIDDVTESDRDPLTAVQYSSVYWIYHFCNACDGVQKSSQFSDVRNSVAVHDFLQSYFLYWIEMLSLCDAISDGITAVAKLERLLKTITTDSNLLSLTQDAYRFLLYNGFIIKNAPLQTYTSALLFAPRASLIRQLPVCQKEEPKWVTIRPTPRTDWSPLVQTLKDHTASVYAVAFSPDGRLVASASGDKTVKLWYASTGEEKQTLKGHDDLVHAVAFSPDGRLVASASYDGTVKLWYAGTGEEKQTLKGHNDSVCAVAFSPDGRLVASASDDKTVKLWYASTGEEKQTLKGHTFWVYAVAFSPDGRLVVSASGDGTVKLWYAGTGKKKQMLKGHTAWVYAVAFSPDGRLVASASGDKTVKLWYAGTGEEKQTLKGHDDSVCAVAFSPDCRLVASASHDGTVKLWYAGTGELQQTLRGNIFISTIEFDVSMSCLHTNIGRISLDSAAPEESAAPAAALNSEVADAVPAAGAATQQRREQQPKQKPYGLDGDGSWIAYNGKRVLWLPHEFQPSSSAALGSKIAVGCKLGRVLLFRFSDAEMPF